MSKANTTEPERRAQFRRRLITWTGAGLLVEITVYAVVKFTGPVFPTVLVALVPTLVLAGGVALAWARVDFEWKDGAKSQNFGAHQMLYPLGLLLTIAGGVALFFFIWSPVWWPRSAAPHTAVVTADQSSTVAISPVGCEFGGPFAYQAGADKVRNFRKYKTNEYFFSEGTKLDSDLFGNSVRQARAYKKDDSALYNYVISADDCEIYVSIWTKDPDEVRNSISDGGYCVDERSTLRATWRLMIDHYEESREPDEAKTSPCWFEYPAEGILDAMSKHFILAQPTGQQDINSMDLDTAVFAKVAYAGEIMVDKEECTYAVNANSGTYRPPRLVPTAVLEHFAKTLGTSPSNLHHILGQLDRIPDC